MFFSSLCVVLYAAAASAATLAWDAPPTRVIDKRTSTCTPKAGGSSSTDDVPAIESAIASCASGTIVIPVGTTYYINSALSFAGCKGCTVEIEGTLQVSANTTYWNGKKAIFTIQSITGIAVISKTGSGLIDGNGQPTYDLYASDSSYSRPILFEVSGSQNVLMQDLYLWRPPMYFVATAGNSKNVTYRGLTLYAVSASGNVAHNTDGFDIGPASDVTVDSCTVTNDDDCVAFKPGASYVTVTNISCTGSHGLSVGSLGSSGTDTVENVYVNGARMTNCSKAAGLKLYPGGSAHGASVVKNVTYENIVVDNSDYAFQIQSCYNSNATYCASNPSNATIAGIVVKGVSGTTSSHYAPTVMNIDCPAGVSCDVTISNSTVKSPTGKATYLCANTPSDIGITCTSGASG